MPVTVCYIRAKFKICPAYFQLTMEQDSTISSTFSALKSYDENALGAHHLLTDIMSHVLTIKAQLLQYNVSEEEIEEITLYCKHVARVLEQLEVELLESSF